MVLIVECRQPNTDCRLPTADYRLLTLVRESRSVKSCNALEVAFAVASVSVSASVSDLGSEFRVSSSRVAVKRFHYTSPKSAMIYASYEGRQLE